MTDADAFRAFEQAGWNKRAEGYEKFFVAVSEHNVAPLLDAAGVRAGIQVLDAGCGPGNLTAAAAARGASVVGTDLSQSMLAVARWGRRGCAMSAAAPARTRDRRLHSAHFGGRWFESTTPTTHFRIPPFGHRWSHPGHGYSQSGQLA